MCCLVLCNCAVCRFPSEKCVRFRVSYICAVNNHHLHHVPEPRWNYCSEQCRTRACCSRGSGKSQVNAASLSCFTRFSVGVATTCFDGLNASRCSTIRTYPCFYLTDLHPVDILTPARSRVRWLWSWPDLAASRPTSPSRRPHLRGAHAFSALTCNLTLYPVFAVTVTHYLLFTPVH